jgi:hypothetical protein
VTLAGDGSGAFAYRVSIDTCPNAIVSLPAMTAAASTNVAARLDGLRLQGQKFSVNANPITCDLKVGGLTITAVDCDGEWSATFDRLPSNVTWLADNVDENDTTIPVASTAGFAASGYVWIDNECIYYASKDATNFLGCTRGALSDDADAATYHYITDGERLRTPEVTDWPDQWEGKRVRIYRYQETDSLTGDGTQVYLGTINTQPQFDGVQWTFGVDPITSILKQTLGADLADASYPRGILYPPEHPLTLIIREANGTSLSGAGFTTSTVATAVLTGFWETQEAFVEALQDEIDAAQTAASQTNLVKAVSDGDVGWHLQYTTLAGGSARAIAIGFRLGGRGGEVSLVDSAYGGPSGEPQSTTGAYFSSVAASTTYYFWQSPDEYAVATLTPHLVGATGIPGAGSVPRGIVDITNGDQQIYLGGASSISTLSNAIMIEWEPTGEATNQVSDSYSLSSYTAASRLLALSGLDFALGEGSTTAQRFWTSASMPSIRFGLTLSEFGGLPLGSLGFMQTITNNQQQMSTLGVVPQLREADWDPVEWRAVAITGQPGLVTRRWYETFSPIEMGAIVREELKLSRAFLAVDSTGRMVPKRMRLPVATELSGSATIDQDTLLTDETLLSHEVSGLGMINDVALLTGYDPKEDKFTGRTIKVRDVASYGKSPSVRQLRIAPKSRYLGPPITDADAVAIAAGIFGTFAGTYAVDTIDAAMHDSVEVGDAVVFDNPHYPDGAGAIGVTGKVGLVIGRSTGAYTPRARLTVLTTRQKLGGYAPSADVLASADEGGDMWSMTVSNNTCPSGTNNSDWFAVADRVRVIEMNTATATVVVGAVVSVNDDGDEIFVQFDSAWGGSSSGTGLWYLTMADSDDAALAETQKRFCSIADSDGIVQYDSGDEPAFRFGA